MKISPSVIILDTETKRLTTELRDSEVHAFYFGNKPNSNQKSVWHLFKIGHYGNSAFRAHRKLFNPTKSLASVVAKRGALQIPPWMKVNSPFGPLKSSGDLARAILKKNSSCYVAYDVDLHEVYLSDFKDYRLNMGMRLGLSVAITWDKRHGYRRWLERDIPDLVEELACYRIIVGANLIEFDYPVLSRYVPEVRERLGFRTIDLLEHARWGVFLAWLQTVYQKYPLSKKNLRKILHKAGIGTIEKMGGRYFDTGVWGRYPSEILTYRNRIDGQRVSLNALARGTLGIGKMGKGKSAPALYHSRQYRKLYEYCTQDVRITRDVFLYGLEHGHFNIGKYRAPVRIKELSSKLKQLRRNLGPSDLISCEKLQYDLVKESPNLNRIEKYFSGWR